MLRDFATIVYRERLAGREPGPYHVGSRTWIQLTDEMFPDPDPETLKKLRGITSGTLMGVPIHQQPGVEEGVLLVCDCGCRRES